MLAPRRAGASRWHRPEALLGLGVLAIGYWGTVALIAGERQSAQPQVVKPAPRPPVHRFERRFDGTCRPPRYKWAQPYPRMLEPVWSPYPTLQKLGLAYGTPPMRLIRFTNEQPGYLGL
jgi:hypothetical protein